MPNPEITDTQRFDAFFGYMLEELVAPPGTDLSAANETFQLSITNFLEARLGDDIEQIDRSLVTIDLWREAIDYGMDAVATLQSGEVPA